MREVVIMRGLPGSGKRRWIETNLDYPFVENGFQAFLKRLAAATGTDRPVVVHGEHLHLYEISPYVYVARIYGIPCRVVTMLRPADGSPTDKDKFEALRYAILPEEWGVRELVVRQEEEAWRK